MTEPFPFIVARGRSGTTLLRAMLDAHPAMAIPDESHFLIQFAKRRSSYERPTGFDVKRFTDELFDHWAFRRWGLPTGDVLAALDADPPADYPAAVRTVYATYADRQGKARYGDKTPSYVLNIESLADLFPEARFVHLIRDGRDVALSYLAADFGSQTLGQAAIAWDRYVRSGRAAGARLGPDRYLELRYEDLVREPEEVLVRLCEFVGLPFDDSMLRYYERADSFMKTMTHVEHHQNLRRPLTTGLRDWKRDMGSRDAAVFGLLAGDLLDELGYEREVLRPDRTTWLIVARYRVSTRLRAVAHGVSVRIRKVYRRMRRRMGRRDPLQSRETAGVSS